MHDSDSPHYRNPEERIDHIESRWSMLELAKHESVTAAGPARNAMVLRYVDAIRGYIAVLLKNHPDTDDLTQDVVVRMLRGEFGGAQSDRGRFRDFLKVAVRNMVRNHWSSQNRRATRPLDESDLPEPDCSNQLEDEWTATWRQSVIDRAWMALRASQSRNPGSVSWTVLRLRYDHPDDDSNQLATRLCEAVGRTFKPDALRQQLRRARLQFGEILVEEVARGIDQPSRDAVEDEIVELGLIEYARDFMSPD